MDRRLFPGEGSAKRAKSRLQRTRSVLLMACLPCACIPLAAQRQAVPAAPPADSRTVRLTVAHQHFGSWRLSYLYVNPDEVWYAVARPDRYKDHAFRVQRSQITARQWTVMGQPQNVTEIKFGSLTYHLWLLPNQDVASIPINGVPQQFAMPYQLLVGVIAAGGNPPQGAAARRQPSNQPPAPPPDRPAARPAPTTAQSAASGDAATTPEKLLAEAQAAYDANRLRVYKTGNLVGMAQVLEPAREKAQIAHAQFLDRRDYAKAAESLIAVADIDRALVMQNPAEYQVKQAPIRQTYADALTLAEQANDAAMQYKALKGLARVNLNSKDYLTASSQISQAIDLATHSGNKDDLFAAYEMRSDVEQQRGNLSAAIDYLDRALNMSGEIKDPSLLWDAYDARGEIYNARADQCDFNHNFEFCKGVFDKGMDDVKKALQVAERLGFDYLKNQAMATLNERKLVADGRAETAATFAKLSQMDSLVTKASQVIVWPHFAPGANPAMAAEVRKGVGQADGPVNAYDPMRPYILGRLAEWEGNDAGALQNYLQAVKLLESDRRKVGDVEGSGSFMSNRIEIYYAAALQYLDRKQYPQAFELIERSRARAMAEMLASRQLSFRTPELQDLFSQSVALRAQIGKAQNNLFDALGSSQPDSEQVKDLQAKVDALQAQDRALESKIQQRAPKLAENLGEKPPVSLEAAQAAARQGGYDLLYYLSLNDGILVWHIGGDSAHVIKLYYSRSQLSDRVASLRKSLSDSNSTFDERLAVELYLVLVNPMLPYIRTNHLVIVPHEDLANLPFQILKKPEDSSYLGERFQISYAPSATVLAGLNRRPDFTHGRLLALADPGIANAVAEVNAIGQLYPGRAKIVTDALASKQSLKNWTSGYNLLHLSVHGTFEANNPLLSYLTLRPAQDDDGRLTAAEMFGLNLADNSLVVLSACETGLVKASHGNDLLGMAPALLFAGASTLVLSSWKVDAGSTAIWMETFYREARTSAPSEAARLALTAVKKQPGFQHPFYWAPFMVTGQ
jgi:CHAT domain-containing protein/tetratricopeptide (TPR) repeat protein